MYRRYFYHIKFHISRFEIQIIFFSIIFVCLSVFLSVQLSECKSWRQFVNSSLRQSLNPSIRLSIYPSAHLYVNPCLRLCVYSSVHLFVCLSARLYVCSLNRLFHCPSLIPILSLNFRHKYRDLFNYCYKSVPRKW